MNPSIAKEGETGTALMGSSSADGQGVLVTSLGGEVYVRSVLYGGNLQFGVRV